MSDPETNQLLTEIRDAQREFLAEYRRVANEALSVQKQSFENQTRSIQQQSNAVKLASGLSMMYRVSLVVAAVLIAALIVWIGRRIGF